VFRPTWDGPGAFFAYFLFDIVSATADVDGFWLGRKSDDTVYRHKGNRVSGCLRHRKPLTHRFKSATRHFQGQAGERVKDYALMWLHSVMS
jgi:hypothetical protein